MAIHVVSTPGQGNPAPQLTSAPPNPPIPPNAPWPAADERTETLAINTFDGRTPVLGPIPAPNVPLPDASTIPPSRIMTSGLPVVQVMPSAPPNVSGPPPIS